MDSKPLIVIIGPTAVGKSSLAMCLGQELDGEIVSGDSRQVYRYMDIGTAKPSSVDRTCVPHHLIDILNPDDEFSLALFLKLANQAIAKIHAMNRTPILVGGTGQYLTALVQGWQVPTVTPDRLLRNQLEQRALQEGGDALYEELKLLDPDASERIDKRNVRRVIRALEISRSESQKIVFPNQTPSYRVLMIGLTMPRPELYSRIDNRVNQMLKQGWLNEVEALLGQGYSFNLPSMSSLGYQELARVLTGEWTLDEATTRIKSRTHRFARHQYAWFRLEAPDIHWFDVSDKNDDFTAVLNTIKQFLAAI